jgi:hypothetical protein
MVASLNLLADVNKEPSFISALLGALLESSFSQASGD